MPNWVTNSVGVHGSEDDVKAFIEKAGKPRPYLEGGEVVMESDREFSFWNFVAPPEDKWELYFGTSGYVNGEKVGDPQYNWYGWNLSNWGCKWDASAIEVDYQVGFASIRFDTPWDAPREIIEAIARQHKELVINWDFEEEQGWGGEVYIDKGVASWEEWDIPDSHAEYDKRGNECPCEWADDFRFDDCPEQKVEVK
jgi:hypothetical protein